MVDFQWNELKNARLKRVRGVSFEEIAKAKLIATKGHPSRPEQQLMLFERQGYIWVVPYVEVAEEVFFLKTLYQSRKYTRLYRQGRLT